MADNPAEAEPVRFGERLASSQAFSGLFREGMTLVEQTAAYLDGPGRNESKLLDRGAANKKKSRRRRRLEVITGRRQTEWTGATRCPEVGRHE